MDPGLIIEYNILRMSFSYVVLSTLQEAVYKNHRNVYLNLNGFGIATLTTKEKLREREFLFVFKKANLDIITIKI